MRCGRWSPASAARSVSTWGRDGAGGVCQLQAAAVVEGALRVVDLHLAAVHQL